MQDEIQLLQTSVPSDIRGQPLKSDGPIGLQEIRFNRTHWGVVGDLEEPAFAIVEGYELVIRRKGINIGIFRRKMDDAALGTEK